MTYWIKTRDRAQLIDLLTLLATRGCKGPGDLSPEAYAKSYAKYPVIRYRVGDMMASGFKTAQVSPLVSHLKTVAQFKCEIALHDKLISQPFKRSRPSFYMGFEIEGCVSDEVRNDLITYVLALYPGHAKNSLIHHDGSIRPKCRGIEIVTPPMAAHTALEKLEWLMGMLSVLSDEGLFETNGTCGLHVNLSEAKSFDWPNPKTRHQFTYEFMKRLDVRKWRRAFGRSRNKYCWFARHPNDAGDIGLMDVTLETANKLGVSLERARHWSAINTTHVNADEPESRRLEVRVAGGKGYHEDLDRLRDFLLDIRGAASEAYGSI